MCRCLNCDGRFFKTLETRILPSENENSETVILMMKKRCKRCKHKYLYKKTLPQNNTAPISYELWEQGTKIAASYISSRGQVHASDYSKKISRHAEDVIPYLNALSRASSKTELPIREISS